LNEVPATSTAAGKPRLILVDIFGIIIGHRSIVLLSKRRRSGTCAPTSTRSKPDLECRIERIAENKFAFD